MAYMPLLLRVITESGASDTMPPLVGVSVELPSARRAAMRAGDGSLEATAPSRVMQPSEVFSSTEEEVSPAKGLYGCGAPFAVKPLAEGMMVLGRLMA